jgi:hypothetical protein
MWLQEFQLQPLSQFVDSHKNSNQLDLIPLNLHNPRKCTPFSTPYPLRLYHFPQGIQHKVRQEVQSCGSRNSNYDNGISKLSNSCKCASRIASFNSTLLLLSWNKSTRFYSFHAFVLEFSFPFISLLSKHSVHVFII